MTIAETRPADGQVRAEADDLYGLLSEAILAARWRPEIERHGLPAPTPERCARVLKGYVPRFANFPPALNLFDNLSTLLGVERIVPEGARFRVAEHGEAGELAVIQAATPSGQPGDTDILDLVAWQPERPGRWWLLKGLATFLGPWPPAGAELRLTATPLAWLRDPDSVCLLSFTYMALEGLLAFGRVTVDDDALAGFLGDQLARRFLPEIEVRS